MGNRPFLKRTGSVAACLLAVGFATASSASAQSLIEALSSAYNSNPDLLAGRAVLRQTDETLAQAVANWRPKVTLSVEYNKIQADSIPIRVTNSAYLLNGRTALLQATQPLFRGGKTVADTKAAQANIQAQRAILSNTEQTILLNSVQAYADLLQDVGIVDARRNNVRVLVEQLDATRERFRVGELTITDVSQAEARLEQAKADLVQAQAQVRIDEAAFQRQIGMKPGKLADLPLIGALPATEEECVSLAMDNSPAAVSAQYRIKAAGYGVNSAVANLLPQVNLIGFVQQQYDVQVPGDQYYQYGIRLQATVPIYQNGSEWSAIRQAKQLVGQRRNELDSARRQAAETVIRAWRNLDSARSRVLSFEAQVRANEVALNGVRQEALVGSRTTLDVLNAEQELLNSQVNLLQARHDTQVSYYGVLSGIGRLTARSLGLPVEYYDEEKYYKEVGSRWIGDGSSDSGK
ncbi:MAG TPA: TolC family outer membrane protein [Reyranella sp.]|jgi:TolC family type I secretion outer membrane protein|nr:TolC family outer membrane protein [Reyranella sp.]